MSHVKADFCERPKIKRRYPDGMLWACDCGRVYRLDTFITASMEGTFRDRRWERFHWDTTVA